MINHEAIKSLIESCYSNNYDKIKENVTEIIRSGHAVSQVVLQLHEFILSMKLSDDQKSEIMEAIAVRFCLNNIKTTKVFINFSNLKLQLI